MLALTNNFKMIDTFSAFDTRKDCTLFIAPFLWNENCDGLPHCLLGRITEDTLSPSIPTCDGAIEVRANDCVIAGFDNRREPPRLCLAFAQCIFSGAAFNQVGGLSAKHIQLS